MTREKLISNGFIDMMKGFWKNQDLEAPNLETLKPKMTSEEHTTDNQEPYDDAISRAWLKGAIHNFYYGLKHIPTEEDIQAYIDAAKPIVQQPKTKWIPVSERLPEEFESVLVCYESQGGMAQAVSERFGTHTGYKWSALAGIEPIAWMPLPPSYQGE